MALTPRSIRARILSLFLLSVAASAVAMGYALSQLRTIGDSLEALDRFYLPLTQSGAEIEAVIRQMERDGERFDRESLRPLAGHRSNATLYTSAIEEATTRARSIIAQSTPWLSAPDDLLALKTLREDLDEIEASLTAHDQALEVWMRAGEDQSAAALSELRRRRTELKQPVGQLSALLSDRIEKVSDRTTRARDRAYVVSGVLTGLAALFAGVLAAVALFTLRPIGALIAQVQRLAAGDYTGPVLPEPVGAGEEVTALAREFSAMAAAVAERDRRLSERAAALDKLSLRQRQILDTIGAGLVVVEDGVVEVVNPAAEATWSVQPGSPLPDWMAALSPGRHEALPRSDQRFDVEVVPFGAQGLLIVGEDVSARLAVRERLARAERLALVGQMLAQITHEVRNPLNAMSLNAELLVDELTTTEGAEMLETITDEIRRLERLTARYLTLSRQRTPEVTTEDPLAMAREIVHLEEAALHRAGVTVAVTGESPGLVELDGDAMRRALRNVLRNAVEAGASSLTVAVGLKDNTVVIAVEDDGPGMVAERVERAFEPFFTTKATGTGLGLSISRQELEEVGGGLHCESTPGRGSIFTLTCPLLDPGDLPLVTSGHIG